MRKQHVIAASAIALFLSAVIVERLTDATRNLPTLPLPADIDKVAAHPPPAPPRHTEAEAIAAGVVGKQNILFWRAMTNHSTAPFMVLITLVRPSGEEEAVCVDPESLYEAIFCEEHWNALGAGYESALKYALAQKDRRFRFTNPDALRWLQRTYTDATLREMREEIAKHNDDQLVDADGQRRLLRHVFHEIEGAEAQARFYALAHAVIERGLVAGRGCVSGELFVMR